MRRYIVSIMSCEPVGSTTAATWLSLRCFLLSPPPATLAVVGTRDRETVGGGGFENSIIQGVLFCITPLKDAELCFSADPLRKGPWMAMETEKRFSMAVMWVGWHPEPRSMLRDDSDRCIGAAEAASRTRFSPTSSNRGGRTVAGGRWQPGSLGALDRDTHPFFCISCGIPFAIDTNAASLAPLGCRHSLQRAHRLASVFVFVLAACGNKPASREQASKPGTIQQARKHERDGQWLQIAGLPLAVPGPLLTRHPQKLR